MRKNFFVMTITIIALISFALGIYADGLRQEITAMLVKDVKITLNGEEYIPRDANGEITYPILYKGVTYLPVRGVANMYVSKVTWNNDTRTVGLWTPDYIPGQEDGYIPEVEMNNSIKNANNFELNSKMKGIVGDTFVDTNDQDEYDFFKFVVKEPGIVTFKVNADHESGLQFELRSRDDELYEIVDITDEDTVIFESPMDPGVYYAGVTSYNKVPYKIENTFKSFSNSGEIENNEMDTAGIIPINTYVKGSLGGYQEYSSNDIMDYFRFEEPLNSINIELSHPGNDYVRVVIYNAQGETLETYDSEYGKLNVTYVPDGDSSDEIGYISIGGGQYPYQLYMIKITE